MKILWARQALLASGWEQKVRVEIDASGRILRVEPGAKPAGFQVHSLLPAPVNSHGHAFQRAMAGLTECRSLASDDNFWSWRTLMYRFLDRLTPEHVQAIASYVQMEMLEAGYGASVEFHYLHHQRNGQRYDKLAEMCERIGAAAAESGIGLLLLPVLYQYGGCDRRDLGAGQRRFGNSIDQLLELADEARLSLHQLPADCGVGLAAHSLRAVALDGLLSLQQHSPDAPIHLHLAEQLAEVSEVSATFGRRPAEWALDNLDLSPRYCLIHCTHLLAHETIALAQTGAVAGLCPITEANLGDGVFDAPGWMEAGGAISVGSDSHVRISLAEELRMLEYSQRLNHKARNVLATEGRSTGRRLYGAVLQGGAAAAGRLTGAIRQGLWADLAALEERPTMGPAELDGDRLLDYFAFAGDSQMVRHVWSAGRHLVRDGRHIRSGAITENYRRAIGEIRTSL